MNELEVKKELYKSKVMAKFSHYVSGNIYYTVELESGTYQFPIETVEDGPVSVSEVFKPRDLDEESDGIFKSPGVTTESPITKVTPTKLLSSDLGTTPFYAEMKGSDLNRWIAMAIKAGEFVKVS